ncbi:MAG: DUF4252 domain-containing protein [Flavobacteriales bacterium]
MKKFFTLLVTCCMCTMAFAQNDAIDSFFSSYADDDNFTKVTISSKMFELLMHVEAEGEDEKEMLETITKLKGMRMLVQNEVTNGETQYKSAIKKIKGSYEVLMTVDDNDEDMTFFIKENNGIITELLMIVGGNDNFMIMSIVGDIDLNQIAKLSRTLDIEGMENLENLEK